ncbi:MAG: AAA family ATPase [Sphingomonadaceae bacterium]
MLTRIEIDGFKTFKNFSLEFEPLTAIVGPNASGKSNLFDAIRFLSRLAQSDIRSAMAELRGQPEELFRQTSAGASETIKFAVEVFLDPTGKDSFGTSYEVKAQRLRYELNLGLLRSSDGHARSVVVTHERCGPIKKPNDRAKYLRGLKISYNANVSDFIRRSEDGSAIEVKQDGRQKHGKPMKFSIEQASRSALSTITTAEFPHLYALREFLGNIKFLEINPQSARRSNDIFEERYLKPDASNLSAVLARLKDETGDADRPDGVLADIAADLSALIPAVTTLDVQNDPTKRQYAFSIGFAGDLSFSSRVISDGTLRLLALLTLLNDPDRKGTLCFEEPENGVHEGRIPMLVEILRMAANFWLEKKDMGSFQVLINTHSPKVMHCLEAKEIVAADMVVDVDANNHSREVRTRMRSGLRDELDLFSAERDLTRFEIDRLLQDSTAMA